MACGKPGWEKAIQGSRKIYFAGAVGHARASWSVLCAYTEIFSSYPKNTLDNNKTTGHLLRMPRPANPDTRSKLLEKGGDLVSRVGFNATGVQEITAAAGVPKGSFYNYFESKEAFAVEVLGAYWGSIAELYGPLLREKNTPPLQRIANHFKGLADFHKRNRYAVGCLIGNMALEVTPASADVRAKLVSIYREWSDALADCLREAQARKELPPTKDTRQLANALIDTFEGTVMRAKVERSGKPFDSFERSVLPCLLA
jgi:TetR/AcrR family transcriptional regulator, transcriptional repressor for nem operon